MSAVQRLKAQAPHLAKLVRAAVAQIAREGGALHADLEIAIGVHAKAEADRTEALAALERVRAEAGTARAIAGAERAFQASCKRVVSSGEAVARHRAQLDGLEARVLDALADRHAQALAAAEAEVGEVAGMPYTPRAKPTSEHAGHAVVVGVTEAGAVVLSDALPDVIRRMHRAGSLTGAEAAAAGQWRADWLACAGDVPTQSWRERVGGGGLSGGAEHRATVSVAAKMRFDDADRALPAEVAEVCRAVILQGVPLDRAPGAPAIYRSVMRKGAASVLIAIGCRRLERVYRGRVRTGAQMGA